MKIVIANGHQSADYLIKYFKNIRNKIIVINSSKDTIQYLTKSNKIAAFYGDPYKKQILDNAHIEQADLFIALGNEDTDNFVACQLAKKVYSVKKVICTVTNPKNVELFKSLGLDSVISSTYLLASSIVSESSLEKLTKSMSLENDKIVLSEVTIKENYQIANRQIMDINFPKTGTISCIYRKPNVIIPNGKSTILANDKLFVVSSKKDQKSIIEFIQTLSKKWEQEKFEDLNWF